MEAEAFLPSQCVLCHEGGVGCKGGKPLGMIALMQPSTVLSAVARRQRAAKRERTEMAEEGGGDNAHVGPGPTCPTCPTSRLSADLVGEDGAAADGGDSGFVGSGFARNPRIFKIHDLWWRLHNFSSSICILCQNVI